eukprot:scaffold73881_cov28-Prasinocladus_malaysianus.AAC.2
MTSCRCPPAQGWSGSPTHSFRDGPASSQTLQTVWAQSNAGLPSDVSCHPGNNTKHEVPLAASEPLASVPECSTLLVSHGTNKGIGTPGWQAGP